MRAAGVFGRLRLIGAAAIASVALVGCSSPSTPPPTAEPTVAPGWASPMLVSDDGVEVSTRYWRRDTRRIVIYLHEYLSEQSAWWPHIDPRPEDSPSALTLDFRGHGSTPGEPDDLEGMIEDAWSALAFARAAGYEQIALVGSGMGAAIAMVIAADEPDVFVIGLSAPSEFGPLLPLEIVPALRDRIALIATEGDLSAAHSLDLFVEAADLPADRWWLFEGRAHGVEMITLEEFAEARAAYLSVLSEAWSE